tara:strand:- start:3263 stop:3724 length:462 start_codon:yes stop_codon:yes gene_type:complete
MLNEILSKIGFFYNKLPRLIREIIGYISALAIPILIFILNYFSGLNFINSLIGAILFTLAFYTIVLFIFIFIAFLWWIYDGFKLFQNKFYSFDGSKLLTPSKIAKTIFSYTNVSKLIKATIEFIIGWCVILIFWTFVLRICFNYISETFIRVF